MDSSPYWFELSSQGKVLGGGFLLTRKYGITATHCLTPLGVDPKLGEDSQADVVVDIDLGMEFVGANARVSEVRGDLTLLEIVHPARRRLTAPAIGAAESGESWVAPYRPSSDFPKLSGKVSDSDIEYTCRDGERVQALQLVVEQSIGQHHGYSGGPVSRVSDLGQECALGVLLEQFPDLSTERRASNVLFAATMAGVFRAFIAFDRVDVSSNGARDGRRPSAPDTSALRERAMEETRVSDAMGTLETVRRKLVVADETLRWAKEWARDGLLDETEYRQVKIRVREFIAPM
jgi:hypothetical protein